MTIRSPIALLLIATAALGAACRDERPAERAVEAGAEKLSENVDDSAGVYDETYDAARERGEGAIAAGGDAYNAVLEIPEEKEEEKESR